MNNSQQLTIWDQEIWRDIKGYEGLYQISNLGRVKSLKRIIKYRDGRDRPTNGQYLKIGKRDLYYCVDLSKNNKVKQIRLHRLLAESFILNPENKPEINHKDGDKLNNDLSNLEWVTHKENMSHAFKIGLANSGDKCSYAKLTEKQVKEIRSKYKFWKYPCSKLSKEYNVCEGTIYSVVNFLNWKRV